MSIFEELIEELKDEALLEETVFALKRSSKAAVESRVTLKGPSHRGALSSQADNSSTNIALPEDGGFTVRQVDKKEVHRRRAVEEVSSLQMVGHILSGIEREHMKMPPQAFDDFDVKKALHRYMQIAEPLNPAAHSAAEYQLFQEIEKWYSTLSKRDNNISVANVRRFCENSRPVLSSQALIALARFYRNSPYNEAVRGKFDFVMTRLFSREAGDEKRKLLFGRIEMSDHVISFYSNWASLSMAGAEDAPSQSIVDSVKRFEAFIREAEAADSFGTLVTSEFFNRVRLFKESSAELFFEPAVIASAIECNVRIGNRFVELVYLDHSAAGENSIEEKYGYNYDTIISGAASKTLLLLDLLREAREQDTVDAPAAPAALELNVRPQRSFEFERAPVESTSSGHLSVNKWFVIATILVLILGAGVYFWSQSATADEPGVETALAVPLTGTELTEHIREASTSSETLYGVTQPTWDALSEEDQKQFLNKAYAFAQSRGMQKVNLLNSRGRTVGYATANRREVFATQ